MSSNRVPAQVLFVLVRAVLLLLLLLSYCVCCPVCCCRTVCAVQFVSVFSSVDAPLFFYLLLLTPIFCFLQSYSLSTSHVPVPLAETSNTNFQARSQHCENQLLASSCLSVRPSAWNSWTPIRRIRKSDIGYFSNISRENSSFIKTS